MFFGKLKATVIWKFWHTLSILEEEISEGVSPCDL
jgi:hypothetical protein